MTVKFNIVEKGNPSDREAPKKFYPSIQATGRLTLQELSALAADRSTLTEADLTAAISTFLTIIPRELARGNIVELGSFGSFWLKTNSDGVETIEEVHSSQITNVQPRFNPGKQFKQALKAIEFNKN